MVFLKIALQNVILAGVVTVILGACTPAEQPKQSAGASSFEDAAASGKHLQSAHDGAQGYRKPGAEIDFAHAFSGTLSTGVPEQLVLSFSHAYPDGVLQVQLSAEDGLELLGDNLSALYVFENGEPATIPITLLAGSSGKFYLNIFASIVTPSHTQGRAFALAIATSDYSSASVAEADSHEGAAAKAAKTENIVVLPAQESISAQ